MVPSVYKAIGESFRQSPCPASTGASPTTPFSLAHSGQSHPATIQSTHPGMFAVMLPGMAHLAQRHFVTTALDLLWRRFAIQAIQTMCIGLQHRVIATVGDSHSSLSLP